MTKIEESNEENARGNIIAHRVWKWLQDKKRISFVPWVLDRGSRDFDPLKKQAQDTQDELLTELEKLMTGAVG